MTTLTSYACFIWYTIRALNVTCTLGMTCKIDQILNAAATVHLAKLQHFCSDNEMDQFLYIHYLNLATVWKKKEN